MLSWPPCHPSRGSTCPTPDTTTWSTWPGPPAGRHVWLTGTCLSPPGREEDGRWCSVWPQHSPSWPRVCGPSDCPAETDLALPVSWGHGGAVASHTSCQYWSPSLYWTHQNYYIWCWSQHLNALLSLIKVKWFTSPTHSNVSEYSTTH